MFWSHDLLGKKTALAAVWVAAHGKKLNKGSIMKVNVAEACDKVIDPEAPQALRLQAILVGGIVFVHARQQLFLLEDVQEMLRRLRSLGREAGGEAAAAKVTLGGEKRAAREEAITLPLTGDLALLNLGELFPAFPSQMPTTSEGGAHSSRSQQVGDGLFAMPSLPDGLGEEALSGGATSRGRSGKRSAGSGGAHGAVEGVAAEGPGYGGGLLLGQGQEEMGLSLDGLPRHDLELLDQPETFAVLEIDLPGMDFFGGGLRAEGDEPAEALPDDLLPVPSGLLGELPPGGQEGIDQPPGSQTPRSSSERSGLGGSAAPRTKPRRRGGKKQGRPTVDDLDTLQIRGRDYRDWMNERDDILVARPQRAVAALPAGAKSALVVAPATAAAMPGGGWPEELQKLFMRHAVLPKAEGAIPKKGRKGGRGEEQEDVLEEQERYLDELAAGGRGTLLADDGLGFAGGEPGFGAGGFMDPGYPEAGMDGYGGYGEEAALAGDGAGPSNQFARRAALRALSGDEESEEEFDVETERLRAALNSTQGMGEPFYLGLTPGSAPDMAATAGAGGRRKRGSSALRRDSESQGLLSEKSSERRGGSRLSDLLEDAPMSGAELGAMLLVVGEEEELQYEEEGGEAGGSGKRSRSGGASGNGLSQFELLEASGPTQEACGIAAGNAGPAAGDHLTKATLAFVNLMRQRFDAAESQLEADGGQEEAPAELSLDGMTERLGRLDAAKAFYAALVARSHGFLQLDQQEPYGDIILRRGQYL